MTLVMVMLVALALGGVGFAFAGGGEKSKTRVAAVAKPAGAARGARAGSSAAESAAQKRKNVAVMLKDIEKNRAKAEKPTMRRRLERAGFPKTEPRTFYMICGIVAAVTAAIAIMTHQKPLVIGLAAFAVGLGLPRWVLGFLAARRKKKFTAEFANAIDVIVRSVKSGLPTNEALRIVAREAPGPVGFEFTNLVESLKVGVTLEQGLKRMRDSMPTAEVGFFAIVMTIQSKSGGNLSEALSNLSGVLRDRKRLQGKIKAMSSEAKASAMIIGSLPPGVAGIVYLTTPAYISLLFTEKVGNLLLVGCAIWMGTGIMVMRKMINFKH
jgi:tight adherence protein B